MNEQQKGTRVGRFWGWLGFVRVGFTETRVGFL